MTSKVDKRRRPQSLQDLRAAAGTMHAAQRRVDDAVAMLRSPDAEGFCLASWAEIGAALGVSAQAAQQKYARRGL